MLRIDNGRGEFRKRVPADLLQEAKGKKLWVTFEAKYCEQAQHFSITVTNQIKFGYRTANPILSVEREAVAMQIVDTFLTGLRGTIKPLHDHQIASYAEQCFALYCKHCDRKENSVCNLEALVSFYKYFGDANDCSEISYKRYRDILPFADSPSYQNWIDQFSEFDENYMMPYSDCEDVHPNDTPVQALEKRFGAITTWWLALRRIKVSPKDKIKLLYAVSQVAEQRPYIGFGTKEQIGIRFDYESIIRNSAKPKHPTTITEAIERWKKDRDLSPNTLESWLPRIDQFIKHIGHEELRNIAEQDIFDWIEVLSKRKLATKTISVSYISSLKSLITYAFDKRWILSNPTASIKIDRSERGVRPKLGYKDDQINYILDRSNLESDPVLRWVSPLLIYSGARVGEIAQLWADQIRFEEGMYVIDIHASRDGGTIKNEESIRLVPLHSKFLTNGFLDFVDQRHGKPLFYEVRPRKPNQKHPLYSICKKDAKWIGTLGLDMTDRQPHHANRYWFKSKMSRLKVQDSIADHIQGHAPANVGGSYRHPDLRTMADAIELIRLEPADFVSRPSANGLHDSLCSTCLTTRN